MAVLTKEQLEGAAFLASRSVAMLADGVGFGKTAQLARACDMVRANVITILCPPILRPNEIAQFDLWSLWGYPSAVIRTGKDDVPMTGLVVCSYDLARNKRIRKKLVDRKADVLILDEAHRVKSPGSKTTKAITNAAGIASTASRVWFCTGTPAPNNASEFYVFAKMAGAWLGNSEEFTREFCITQDTQFGLQVRGTKPEKRDALKALLAPHMIQRIGIDPERPPLTIDELPVEGRKPDFSEVDPASLARIEAAAAQGSWKLLDDPAIATVRRLVGLAKAEAAAELMATEMQDSSVKTLVFCLHTAVIDLISDKLQVFGAAVIDGRTGPAERQRILEQFQSGEGLRAIVAHNRAAGEGLTLTAANRVVIVEPYWSPEDNNQLIARAWRRGQKRPVHVSFVYLSGSIDHAVSKTLSRKALDTSLLRIQQQ